MATAMAEPRAMEAHATKKRPYVYVFGALAAVTALELNVGILGLAHDLQVAALLMMATLKASLVAAYYMHLRYEPRIIRLLPVAPLVFVVLLVIIVILH